MKREEMAVERYEKLSRNRSIWEDHWQQVAERIWPAMSDAFFNNSQTAGERRTQKVFDATGGLALDRFASVLQSMLNPSNQRWHMLDPSNPDLLKDHATAIWFEEATNILFRERYNPRSRFTDSLWGMYKSEGAFGNGCVFVDRTNDIMRYKGCHLSNTFVDEDQHGNIDTVYRKFKWSLRNIVQRFGEEQLPERWREEFRKEPGTEKEILHVVTPREDFDPKRADNRGKPFLSMYVGVEHKIMLEEGGYTSFPYIFPRYDQSVGEIYGRGPAMTVLPEIQMTNEMSKTIIRAAHRAVSPPILVHDDGILGAGSASIDMRPDGVNYGAINDQGRQLIQPFNTGSNPGIGEEMLESRRKVINDAFLVTLFQILVETPEMTATEALIRAQEKGALLTPSIERQRHQVHTPIIEREIDLLTRAGKLPPLTPAMIEARGEYEIRYQSPLNRMQDSEELVGIQRTLEMITPLAQFDPSVVELFDYQEIARKTARINGAPASIVKSQEQVEADAQARQAQIQQQQMVEGAPKVAGAMKDIAQAQKLQGEAGI